MLAWFNGNLTDMPWYGLLVTIILAITSVLAVFAVLEMRGHRRIAVAFTVLLLLLSIPSMMHYSFGVLTVPEAVMFYVKQIYLPILAATSLFFLLKKRAAWQTVLRWGIRVYAVFGIMIGTIILHAELTRNMSTAGLNDDMATVLSIIAIVGTVLTVSGLIINPLYVVWRNAVRDTSVKSK